MSVGVSKNFSHSGDALAPSFTWRQAIGQSTTGYALLTGMAGGGFGSKPHDL
jgi:hypothetical protein